MNQLANWVGGFDLVTNYAMAVTMFKKSFVSWLYSL